MLERSNVYFVAANFIEFVKISIVSNTQKSIIGSRKIRRSERFRPIYPLTTINSLPFFRMKTKLQSNKNSNHGGGGSFDLHSPLSFCIRSASNANSTAYATRSLPANCPCKTISIIKKETRFSTRFTVNHLYVDYFEKKKMSSFISTSIAKSPRFSR